MTVREIQKQQPRTFDVPAAKGNLESIKRLLVEAGATITRTIRIKPGVIKLYLTWPSDEP
jgi:hypothetical protein